MQICFANNNFHHYLWCFVCCIIFQSEIICARLLDCTFPFLSLFFLFFFSIFPLLPSSHPSKSSRVESCLVSSRLDLTLESCCNYTPLSSLWEAMLCLSPTIGVYIVCLPIKYNASTVSLFAQSFILMRRANDGNEEDSLNRKNFRVFGNFSER